MSTILLIEDDTEVARMIVMVLRIEGYNVHVAKDCVSALEYLATFPKTSLILMDLITAGTKDQWFLARLQSDSKLQHVPVIAVNDRPVLFSGVAETVQKPFQWAKLLALIKRHVSV